MAPLTTPLPQDQHVDVAIRDGSEQFGSILYGAVTGTYNTNEEITIKETYKGRAWCNPGTSSSYRVEAAGESRLLVQEHVVLIAYLCDNQSLIRALNTKTPLNPLAPECDMIEPTRKIV